MRNFSISFVTEFLIIISYFWFCPLAVFLTYVIEVLVLFLFGNDAFLWGSLHVHFGVSLSPTPLLEAFVLSFFYSCEEIAILFCKNL